MSHNEDVPQPDRQAPAQVEQVLQRAVAIDINDSDSLSLDQLRAVADEAGISQAALAAAVRELGGAKVNAPADSARLDNVSLRPPTRLPAVLRGRTGMLAAGAVGASGLIVLMWLIGGILQHFGH